MRKSRLTVGAAIVAAATAATTTLPAAAATTPATAPLPSVTVLKQATGAGHGDIFLSPSSTSAKYASGVQILSPDGAHVVWSHPTPAGQTAADFRAQTYRGKPVLTWWQGVRLGGLASGVDVVYDQRYRKVAEVRAGNGYTADGHEFLITPRNTALILAYATATADLRSLGGSPRQKVVEGVVQEIDIASGKVLFQWKASEHVPYRQSEQPLPASPDTPWDWFHVNAVKLDQDGNLLIDARNTWTAYEISRHDGRILWQLGGKASSFTLAAAAGQKLNKAGKIFAWQHDPEPLGDGRYSFFDNEAAGAGNTGNGTVSELPYSRVVTVRVDVNRHRATLTHADDQPAGLLASSQGNAQPERGGNVFVGWGSLPYVSEFDQHGALVFNATYPAGVNTYRAYRLAWR